FFFFSSRRRHTRSYGDWSSDVCSSDLEGDEYDTAYFDKGPKFMHYLPEVAIINNIEFDHADIYKDLDAVKLAFRRLMNLVPGERSEERRVGKECGAGGWRDVVERKI